MPEIWMSEINSLHFTIPVFSLFFSVTRSYLPTVALTVFGLSLIESECTVSMLMNDRHDRGESIRTESRVSSVRHI